MGSQVTLAQVAERAGVSLATASRVVNGSERVVGARFRERVLAAAEELGYTANTFAQAVARGRSDVVGLVVPDIQDPYFSVIAAAAMAVVEPSGEMMLGTTLRRQEQELRYVSTMRARQARAVIMVGSRTTDNTHTRQLAEAIAEFVAGGGRAVVIGQDKLGADTVLPLNRAGAKDLALALVDQGHRSFGILAGPSTLLTAKDRVDGFIDGLARRGRRPSVILHSDFTRDGGYQAMSQLLDRRTTPGCVFAVNDVMAIGAMAAVRERGVKIAVAGFDDIPTLRDVAPSLTTVRLPLEDMGRMAASMAMDEPGERRRVIRVKGEVILRDSTTLVRNA
ncbi:LacI family DNA-binding transcriptional regulator [Kibdelosporangium persicum]|uniref:HTH-type transcriptional regulator DegA n=1 Tax=Kibdelosporangium persicum TaxID=2698649 RepID=A0ABX2F8J9_9PSEU|nr:LacI family DNA-binding transcriptional regulator [Kibdelosporangium persicum]NRN67671.1 HTH-type transcriptional regulator DegA [Kibdelosporangium persicum]